MQNIEEFLELLPEPNGENEDLILLKGHLFIERGMEEFLANRGFDKLAFKKSNFSFYKRVILCRSLCEFNGCEWLWDSIENLSQARNKLAHDLDANAYKDKLRQFMSDLEGVQNGLITDDIRGRGEAGGHDNSLGCAISYLSGELARLTPPAEDHEFEADL